MTGVEPAVLFASDDIVVADKPSGMATEPDRERAPSLRDWVKAWAGGKVEPHAVSRLDVGVSGAVTFALSARAKKAAAVAKERGKIARRYVAIVAGDPGSAGHADAPVEGKPARTDFARVALITSPKSAVALVVFSPRTGRMHQIRIHAAALGAPILGDKRYGGPGRVTTGTGRVVAVERVLLHAASVVPALGLPTDPPGPVLSPIPEALGALWSSLDGAPEAWKDVDRCVVAFSEPPS